MKIPRAKHAFAVEQYSGRAVASALFPPRAPIIPHKFTETEGNFLMKRRRFFLPFGRVFRPECGRFLIFLLIHFLRVRARRTGRFSPVHNRLNRIPSAVTSMLLFCQNIHRQSTIRAGITENENRKKHRSRRRFSLIFCTGHRIKTNRVNAVTVCNCRDDIGQDRLRNRRKLGRRTFSGKKLGVIRNVCFSLLSLVCQTCFGFSPKTFT